jgi:hypothetical protein
MWVNPSDGVAVGGAPNAIDHFEKSTNGAVWDQTQVLSKNFVLSANTAVTFTADASTALGVVVPPGSVVLTPPPDA